MQRQAKVQPLTLFLLFLTTAAGCQQDPLKPDTAASPAPSAALTIKGSDTLLLFTQQLAERFMQDPSKQGVQITGGGSGTGIAALTNGTTQIAATSRAMKETEKERLLQRRGLAAVEHPVALDGVAIYVHQDNPVTELSLRSLRAIFTGEVRNWQELGGPDARITLYSRENNSGTYAFFKELVLEEEDFAAEVQPLSGTAAVVDAVRRDPLAIGYGGNAFSAGVRALAIRKDEASPAVVPSWESVSSGAYPIRRPLFLYTAGPAIGGAAAFLAFTLSPEGQALASRSGIYPLPPVGEGSDAGK